MAEKDKKKIAVLVRERTGEGLRMALGLTLFDDSVDVYLIGVAPGGSGQDRMNIEMLQAMKAGLYSLCEAGGFTRVKEEAVPERLLDYDVVIAY